MTESKISQALKRLFTPLELKIAELRRKAKPGLAKTQAAPEKKARDAS